MTSRGPHVASLVLALAAIAAAAASGCARDWDFPFGVPSTGGQPSNPGGTGGTPAPETAGSSGAPGGNGGVPVSSGGTGGVDPELHARCVKSCNGGVCVGGVCEIDCGTGPCSCVIQAVPCRLRCKSGECQAETTCTSPAGCEILCEGTNSCAALVRAPQGSSVIRCSGSGSCKSGVSCSGENCEVRCSGANSCRSNVSAAVSEKAVLACSGQNSCLNASCSGAVCSVECNEAIGACPNDVCCEAGLCQPFQGASDSCP